MYTVHYFEIKCGFNGINGKKEKALFVTSLMNVVRSYSHIRIYNIIYIIYNIII